MIMKKVKFVLEAYEYIAKNVHVTLMEKRTFLIFYAFKYFVTTFAHSKSE